MLTDYGLLHSTGTAEAVQLSREYQVLFKKHPDYIQRRFLRTHGQEARRKAAREAEEKKSQDMAEKRKNFVPSDTSIFGVLGYGHHAVVVYQYHVGFYNLPSNVVLKRQRPSPKAPLLLYSNGHVVLHDKTFIRDLKPFKVMTFQHKIQTSRRLSIAGPLEFRHFIWVCDDLLGGYVCSNDEECRILDNEYPATNGIIPWINQSGEYHQFCGAISPEGKIIYQIPFKQHMPDTALQLGRMNHEGTSIIIHVGEIITGKEHCDDKNPLNADCDEGLPFNDIGNFRKNLIYTYPNRLEVFSTKDGDQFAKALMDHKF